MTDGVWVVWRQDDNGNRFVVTRRASRVEAEEVASEMEARGHKQLYWVAAATGEPLTDGAAHQESPKRT